MLIIKLYPKDFLYDLRTYGFQAMKMLCDILKNYIVQRYLSEEIRSSNIIDYNKILNQLNDVYEYLENNRLYELSKIKNKQDKNNMLRKIQDIRKRTIL